MRHEQQDVFGIPNDPEFSKIPDCFFEDFRTRPLCLTYVPMAIGTEEMMAVRGAMGDRRPRLYQVPTDPTQTIAINSNFMENVSMIPGTVIWGIQSVVSELDESSGNNYIRNYRLRITDMSTGVQLCSEFLTVAPFANSTYGSHSDNEGLPHILPTPIMVLDPGEILVEIGTRLGAAGSVNFQVLLFCSEPVLPCDVRRAPVHPSRRGGR